ncbi:RnfABCDGE type electron transport complex subunit D [Cyanobacteria bacterium FACHB-63]|nr:RnfABCDGE type electron transport complex subunit D [Cyanobacteria bacterium FACHB-63]
MFQDARMYQILFLSLFLLVGMITRDWTLHLGMIATAIATCTGMQWILARTRDQPFTRSLPSALITALGMSVLLRADHYTTIVLACCAAIGSKFVLRVGEKHLFNPGNFGIITALLLTSDAWVSPGQWGEEGWYAVLFLATGGLVLKRVGRWDTTIAFLAAYGGLEAIRNVYLGWTWDVWGHRLMSGSLLMFALFMITDPRTIPNAQIGRVIWAVAIAMLTFILRNQFFISTAVFWALFALAPLSMVIDRIFPDSRFSWEQRATTTEPLSI